MKGKSPKFAGNGQVL